MMPHLTLGPHLCLDPGPCHGHVPVTRPGYLHIMVISLTMTHYLVMSLTMTASEVRKHLRTSLSSSQRQVISELKRTRGKWSNVIRKCDPIYQWNWHCILLITRLNWQFGLRLVNSCIICGWTNVMLCCDLYGWHMDIMAHCSQTSSYLWPLTGMFSEWTNSFILCDLKSRGRPSL